MLAFYGEKDEKLMAQLSGVKEAMEKYQKNFQYYVYLNTGHAFFNGTNPVIYVKESADDAWQKSLGFLREYLL